MKQMVACETSQTDKMRKNQKLPFHLCSMLKVHHEELFWRDDPIVNATSWPSLQVTVLLTTQFESTT